MIDVSKIRAVLVIGGAGRRLRPLTSEKPKAMLPVGIERKPLLEFVIKPWIKFGIKKYLFCTGYKSEMIESYFGYGSKWNVQIEYSREEGKLETGGAIKNAIDNKKLSKDKPIVVFYCDDLVRFNVRNFINSHLEGMKEGFKATLIVVNKFRTQYGIVEVENLNKNMKKVVSFKEKPLIDKHTNVGIYCLEPEVLELIDEHQPPFKFERVILPELVKRGCLMAHEISFEDWIPVNTVKEYEQILERNLTDFYSKF